MKTSREVEIRVTCKLPYSVSVQEFKECIEEAIEMWSNPFYDFELRDLIKVKRRRPSP